MLAASDDIPALAIRGATGGYLDRGQVRAEVTGEFVNEETAAVRSLGWGVSAASSLAEDDGNLP